MPNSSAGSFWFPADEGGRCPICMSEGMKDFLSDWVLWDARVALSGDRRIPLVYLRCGACGSVYAPETETPSYEAEEGSEDALRYYLEEGAGIDLLIEPLFHLDRSGIRYYAEIGCSFGFSLDFARWSLGWEVRGIDPSPLAAAGRDALGLPIESRYFTEDHPFVPEKADLLQVAEVIEHVTDTHGFVRGLLASLSETGILVISTPNAAALQPNTPDSLLLQVLQPGVHLRLFTAKALIGLAEAQGLHHHHVRETPEDVTLYAARQPFMFHENGGRVRDLYLDYLQHRLPTAPPGSALRRGLQSRLLRELTLQGRFSDMDPVLPDILKEYSNLGLDLEDPATIVPPPVPPFNVGGLLYCLGMRQIIGEKDPRRGIVYLDACVKWQSQTTAPLSIAGIEDASTASTARIAAWQALTARIGLDPLGEHDRRAEAESLDNLSAFHRRMLFAELVNRGDHVRATSHYEFVSKTINTLEHSTDAFVDGSTTHHAMTLFTLGIFTLNHLGAASIARSWFARAIDVTGRDPTCRDIREGAVVALDQATEIEARGAIVIAEARSHNDQTFLRRSFGRRLISRLSKR